MTGRLVKWAIELGEYDITYEPRGPIKAQALSDFVAELTLPSTEGKGTLDPEEIGANWVLSVDDSSNQ